MVIFMIDPGMHTDAMISAAVKYVENNFVDAQRLVHQLEAEGWQPTVYMTIVTESEWKKL